MVVAVVVLAACGSGAGDGDRGGGHGAVSDGGLAVPAPGSQSNGDRMNRQPVGTYTQEYLGKFAREHMTHRVSDDDVHRISVEMCLAFDVGYGEGYISDYGQVANYSPEDSYVLAAVAVTGYCPEHYAEMASGVNWVIEKESAMEPQLLWCEDGGPGCDRKPSRTTEESLVSDVRAFARLNMTDEQIVDWLLGACVAMDRGMTVQQLVAEALDHGLTVSDVQAISMRSQSHYCPEHRSDLLRVGGN